LSDLRSRPSRQPLKRRSSPLFSSGIQRRLRWYNSGIVFKFKVEMDRLIRLVLPEKISVDALEKALLRIYDTS
jgi:hypothetical protein